MPLANSKQLDDGGGKLRFYRHYLASTTANGREPAWSLRPHLSCGNMLTSLETLEAWTARGFAPRPTPT